ncbi:NADH:flavin oxidoreductase/NADH oxidase family protein [Streptomyces sp. 846.5]|nr:NADH:flavin oxidoreductase/NADH oxidase family protein [Streptomyces sp. 846.5]
MCQYSAASEGPDTGAPNDWHFQHLAARAVGGAGLILTEATAVSPGGRISSADLGIWNEHQQQAFRRITAFVESAGAVPGIQLAHAGRNASVNAPWVDHGSAVPADRGGWQTLGPSAVAFGSHPVPAELTTDQIGFVVRQFAEAAECALAAGFKVAEVHGAHGYLVHEFLSPCSNTRTDVYGGSLENRMRFALEVVDAVRAVWPEELPLFLPQFRHRLAGGDWRLRLDRPGHRPPHQRTAGPWRRPTRRLHRRQRPRRRHPCGARLPGALRHRRPRADRPPGRRRRPHHRPSPGRGRHRLRPRRRRPTRPPTAPRPLLAPPRRPHPGPRPPPTPRSTPAPEPDPEPPASQPAPASGTTPPGDGPVVPLGWVYGQASS